MSVIKHFSFMAMIFVLSACGGGRSSSPIDLAPQMTGTTLTLLRYDTSLAYLKISGHITGAVLTPYTLLSFHATATCVDNAIGAGTANDFSNAGIQIQLPSAVASTIYARTNTDNGCYRLVVYAPATGLPLPPAFTSTSPPSPSRTSYTPTVMGTTSGSIATVNLYSDGACSTLVGSGTGSDFVSVGIGTTLPQNATTTIYAQTIEPFGTKSVCTLLTNYIHDSSLAPAPVLTSMSPPSPSRASTSVTLLGTVDPTVTGVSIYSDPACSQQLVSGSSTDFTSTGLVITVAANTSTTFYAQSVDAMSRVSACSYVDTFTNDTVPPVAPAYVSLTPGNPTRLTIYPKIIGTASGDTVSLKLYNSALCVNEIGSGTLADFTGLGVTASARGNATTSIYAVAFDQAGNPSSCTQMIDFTNNTIPPDQPQYVATNPASPNNQSITPYVIGNVSSATATVNFFSDAICTAAIGSGVAADFIAAGIRVTVGSNTTTSIFAEAVDAIGNTSACTLLTDYAHSTVAAPAPVYTRTVPASPSKASLTPMVQGSSGANVVDIKLFADPTCTSMIGDGRKSDFEGSGVQASVTANAQTSIYATATDVYGNGSPCVFMANYTHDNIPPAAPTYSSVTPASPNRTSQTPSVRGGASADTTTVTLYDSDQCTSAIGSGTGAVFAGAGLQITVANNSSTSIYAKAFDQAGNATACTFMTTYVYDKLPPGQPNLTSASPVTPSYNNHVTFKGTLAASTDFLPTTAVNLYVDSLCSSPLVSGSPALWASPGLTVDVPINTITTVYGQSVDQVGNLSTCSHLIDYNHNNAGPTSLQASLADNGSVNLNWFPDNNAVAYIVKRSTQTGGPYTIINPYNVGPSFTDTYISDNTTYYYVVASVNSTGISLDSGEASTAVTIGTPPPPALLTATASSGNVNLSWGSSSADSTYLVYRGTQSGGPYTVIAKNVANSNYFDSGLTNGLSYYYVVRTSNAHGLSGYSNEVVSVPRNVPAAPTNLQGTYVSGVGYVLTWSAPSYYTSFTIKRGNTTGSLSSIATVSGNTFTYTDNSPITDNNLNSNYYAVSALYGSSPSSNSNQIGFSNLPGTTITAAAGANQVALTWVSIGGVTDYVVYRATQPGGPYSVLVASTTSAAYNDASVTNGVTYYYVVKHRYTDMDGEPSSEVSSTPGAVPMNGATNLVVQKNSANQALLNWSAPGIYDWFNVYRSSSASGPFSQVNGNPVTSATFTDFSAPVGANYYRVTSVWGSSETTPSNVVVFRNGTTASLIAASSATSTVFTWTAISGASGYQLLRSTNVNGPFTVANASVTSPYTDSTATMNEGYYYELQSKYADGTVGQASNLVRGQWGTSKIPRGLSAVTTTGSTVQLRWTPAVGTTSFRVYRGSVSGGPYSLKDTVSSTIDTLVGLSSYQKQYYVVTSVVSGVESTASNEVSIVTASPLSAPQASPGNNSVALTWLSSFGADSYTLLRSTDSVNFTTLQTGLTTTTFTDATAVNGTLYFYEVYPVYSGVTTIFPSPMSTGVTPGVVPGVPGNISVLANTDGSDVTLQWGGVMGATSYNIYMSSAASGPFTLYQNVNGSSNNIVSGLTAGTAVYFEVSALRGTVESTTSTVTGTVPMVQPIPPTALIVNNNSILVSWTSMSCGGGQNATSYDVLRANNDHDFAPLASGVTSTSYSDTSYTNGTSYEYEIIAYCGTHILGSTTASSSPHVTPGVAPLAPQSLVLYSMTPSTDVLTWSDVPTAATYNVYRSTVSGGPYTLMSSPTIPSFNDTALSAGTYYYVVSAVGPGGMESAMSSEAGITLALAAPTGLAASSGVNSTTLSWSAASGASTYSLYRSVQTGGPYGLIQSGLTTLAATDSTAIAGATYYYVLTAVTSSSLSSGFSNEATAVSNASITLQVPVEMVDTPIASNTAAVTFSRTQTSLDPNAYDGTVGFFFEVVATNNGASAAAVNLVDSANTVYATANVPAATSVPTRIRVSMSPAMTKTVYAVQMPATVGISDVALSTARMIVTQVNATKTKIYIPLLSQNRPATTSDASPLTSTSATSFSSLTAASVYKRQASKLVQINDYNAWELEVVASASNGATGAFALIDSTTNAMVVTTETLVSQASPTFVSVPFDEGTDGFASANENDLYEVSLLCYSSCTSGAAGLYHAGLWVSLSNVSQVQVYERLALGVNPLMSAKTLDDSRVIWDASQFSNPVTYFQTAASSTSSLNVELNQSMLDGGTGDLTPVSSSIQSISGSTKTMTRSPVTLTSGRRLVPDVDPGGSSAAYSGSMLIIEAH